jgi:hypothetical protein
VRPICDRLGVVSSDAGVVRGRASDPWRGLDTFGQWNTWTDAESQIRTSLVNNMRSGWDRFELGNRQGLILVLDLLLTLLKVLHWCVFK